MVAANTNVVETYSCCNNEMPFFKDMGYGRQQVRENQDNYIIVPNIC